MENLKKKQTYKNRLKFKLRRVVGQYPGLYIPLKNFQSKYGILNSSTEIVIEGYPRCANSFAEAAFRIAQGRETEIAHHTHAPAQVLAGVRRNIPTLVLFRNPDDAVISRLIRHEDIMIHEAYKEYLWFYESIWHVLDKCVLSSFEITTGAFGKVIDNINNQYGTNFLRFDHSDPLAIENTKNLIDDLSFQRIGRKTSYVHHKTNDSQNQQLERAEKKAFYKKHIARKKFNTLRTKAKGLAEELYKIQSVE